MIDTKDTIELPCLVLDKGIASHSISLSEVFQYYAKIRVPFCVGLSKES